MMISSTLRLNVQSLLKQILSPLRDGYVTPGHLVSIQLYCNSGIYQTSAYIMDVVRIIEEDG